MFPCRVFTTAAVDGGHEYVCLPSPPQVALIDVNESAGRSLVGVLEKEFGPGRVLFLSCDVESEEKLRGLVLPSSLRHNHVSIKPESQIQIVNFQNLFFFFFQGAFQKIAETYGGVDIFCNNAGILNEIQWQKTVSINLVRKHRFFCLT